MSYGRKGWGYYVGGPIAIFLFFLFFMKPPAPPPPVLIAASDPKPEELRLVKHKSAPLDLPGLDGNRYSLSGYKGHVVVIEVRGSWCDKCDTDLDNLEQIKSSNRGKTVKFLAIDGDETFQKLGVQQMKETELRAFVSGRNLTFPVLLADDKSWNAWGRTPAGENRVMPLTYVIDQRGRVRYEKSSATQKEIQAAIDKVLASSHELSEQEDAIP
jgi:peroxiredoxin